MVRVILLTATRFVQFNKVQETSALSTGSKKPPAPQTVCLTLRRVPLNCGNIRDSYHRGLFREPYPFAGFVWLLTSNFGGLGMVVLVKENIGRARTRKFMGVCSVCIDLWAAARSVRFNKVQKR